MKYIFIALLFISCNKDYRALHRVLGNQDLRDSAYKAILPEHPCIVHDSIVQFIQGENITEYKRDTTYIIDTIERKTAEIPSIKVITKYIQRIDTCKIFVEDRRLVAANEAELNKAKGVIDQLNKDKKADDKWKLYFFILCALELARIIIKYTRKIAWL